jgi:LacI family transcriptional regulator
VEKIEEKTVVDWLAQENPDVIVFAHAPEMMEPLRAVLTGNGRHIPSDLGVVVLTQLLEGTGFSGLQPNHTLIGIRAVDSLVARVSSREFGLPTNPHMETLEGKWIEGQSLRRMLPVNQPL